MTIAVGIPSLISACCQSLRVQPGEILADGVLSREPVRARQVGTAGALARRVLDGLQAHTQAGCDGIVTKALGDEAHHVELAWGGVDGLGESLGFVHRAHAATLESSNLLGVAGVEDAGFLAEMVSGGVDIGLGEVQAFLDLEIGEAPTKQVEKLFFPGGEVSRKRGSGWHIARIEGKI